MDNFETDNQDKSNLVGDANDCIHGSKFEKCVDCQIFLLTRSNERLKSAMEVSVHNHNLVYKLNQELSDLKSKVMSDAVDKEQADIKRNDENLALIDEVRELKDALEYTTDAMQKARAWDDLEALVKEACYLSICEDFEITSSLDFFTSYDCLYLGGSDLKEAVSNALESIKGES